MSSGPSTSLSSSWTSQLTRRSCLDDEELDFLGAPWHKYEELACKNGIDVLRWVFFLHAP